MNKKYQILKSSVRAISVLSLTTLILLSVSHAVFAGPPGETSKWVPTFVDDFTNFDTNKWSRGWSWFGYQDKPMQGTFKNDDVFYVIDRPNNAFVDGGILHLTAREQKMGGKSYTSGVVTSFGKLEQRYGYFEMKAMVPRGEGCAPAFRLMRGRPHHYPPEIDIVEIPTSPSPHAGGGAKAHMVNHYFGAPDVAGVYSLPEGKYGGGFHTFGLLWQPGLLVYYVDGIERFRTTRSVTNQPLYMILCLEVGFFGAEWAGNPAQTRFPQEMLIDWVRVWKPAKGQPLGSVILRATKSSSAEILGSVATRSENGQIVLAQETLGDTFATIFDIYSATEVDSNNDEASVRLRDRSTGKFLTIDPKDNILYARGTTAAEGGVFLMKDAPSDGVILTRAVNGNTVTVSKSGEGESAIHSLTMTKEVSNVKFLMESHYGYERDDANTFLTEVVGSKLPTPPTPWKLTNIGTGVRGAAAYQSNLVSGEVSSPKGGPGAGAVWLVSNGQDVYFDKDSFTFLNQKCATSQNLSIEATIHSVSSGGVATAGGLMLRSNLTPESNHVNLRITPEGEVVLGYRTPNLPNSAHKSLGRIPFPAQLKLERIGNKVRALVRRYDTWDVLGEVENPLGTDVFAGLMVFSHRRDRFVATRYSNILVRTYAVQP
jgi:beta-glucanase (GH16 family)